MYVQAIFLLIQNVMLTTLLQCTAYFITSYMRLHQFVVVTNMAACVCLNCDIGQAKEKEKKKVKLIMLRLMLLFQ